MRKQEAKRLENHFYLEAMYLQQLKDGFITVEDYIKKVALLNKNTFEMILKIKY